jgi:hypothetical protein
MQVVLIRYDYDFTLKDTTPLGLIARMVYFYKDFTPAGVKKTPLGVLSL